MSLPEVADGDLEAALAVSTAIVEAETLLADGDWLEGTPENTAKAHARWTKEINQYLTGNGLSLTISGTNFQPFLMQLVERVKKSGVGKGKETCGVGSFRQATNTAIFIYNHQKLKWCQADMTRVEADYPHNHPRTCIVKQILKDSENKSRELKASTLCEQNVDGLHLALHIPVHIANMADLLLCKKAWLEKNGKKATRVMLGGDLRLRMFILGALGCLQRGAEMCEVRLPCLSVGPLDIKDEGPTPLKLFCSKVPRGKTGARYLAMIRGLNWRTCPVISQGLYMFWHFDMRSGRAAFRVPNMKVAAEWSGLYLISNDPQNKTMFKAANLGVGMHRILQQLGIEDETKRKAHLLRALGAQAYEMGGIPEEEVDKTGLWNMKLKNMVYKNNMAPKAYRYAAGLRAGQLEGNCYWNPLVECSEEGKGPAPSAPVSYTHLTLPTKRIV
eukprot:TRINITY_DN5025_c0_g1_i4.p1 TRINITY_DN5025_c0_g1~~TRINITY_DN5025_c0_g1_i4.p1  ORF type:complete len:445 (-),score=70.63 TRINITY_DN5025_c0_g1_i4:108-1442(-)